MHGRRIQKPLSINALQFRAMEDLPKKGQIEIIAESVWGHGWSERLKEGRVIDLTQRNAWTSNGRVKEGIW